MPASGKFGMDVVAGPDGKPMFKAPATVALSDGSHLIMHAGANGTSSIEEVAKDGTRSTLKQDPFWTGTLPLNLKTTIAGVEVEVGLTQTAAGQTLSFLSLAADGASALAIKGVTIASGQRLSGTIMGDGAIKLDANINATMKDASGATVAGRIVGGSATTLGIGSDGKLSVSTGAFRRNEGAFSFKAGDTAAGNQDAAITSHTTGILDGKVLTDGSKGNAAFAKLANAWSENMGKATVS